MGDPDTPGGFPMSGDCCSDPGHDPVSMGTRGRKGAGFFLTFKNPRVTRKATRAGRSS